MKSFIAFFKKELCEEGRSGKLVILLIVFVLFGIMNPAIAKLTPWMMELLSDSLAENGMTITAIEVDAITSWTQFYKNIPMALLVFVLLHAAFLTSEYQKGTLIPILTKGLSRWKVVSAKALSLILLWTVGYALVFGITYGYNAYFWDNSIAHELAFAAVAYYFFGVWVISLMLLFSSVASTSTTALVGTAGCVLAANLISLIPKTEKYLPNRLCNGMALLTAQLEPSDFAVTFIVTFVLVIANLICAMAIFNRKKL